ncbi:MAG: RagB/SusD family nutrient uptake outer membrane protein [Muribaculaceae bacterium]|nr:RagB/SusD family nutrient uptake outer membrane protein [Muribaculaceae bacterium]
MKHKINRLLVGCVLGAAAMTACVDDIALGDSFLEKAPGVDVTIDTVFSKAEYAKMFLWESYKGLYDGFSDNNTINSGMPEAISDIVHCNIGWISVVSQYYSGMQTESGNDNGWVGDKFAFLDTSNRKGIWGTVRACWLFIQNVDRVPDMSAQEKARLKAEARLIIASRYYDAMCHFGGLPLVDHAYETGENFEGGYLSGITGEGELVPGRATVEQTAEFIDNLLVQVINDPALPFSITDYMAEGGRLTKGGAYGLRAKLWWYVASPLFNDSEPYMQYAGSPKVPVGVDIEGEPILRVWLGRKDNSLWNKCLDACEDFFRANTAAGNPFALQQADGTTEADYRRAYRTAYYNRETSEKIIEVRNPDHGEYLQEWWPNVPCNVAHYGGHAPTLEWFNMFPWADGRNFDGQRLYDTDNAENIDIFADRDPRLYENILVPHRMVNNQYDTFWDNTIDTWEGGDLYAGQWYFPQGYLAHGFGQFKWSLDFQDNAYERFSWPYLRMADMHLVYAEALAHTGNHDAAVKEVDKVRARVGLPSLKVNTALNLADTGVLVEEILRERACELGLENCRLMDLIRYKRTDLFCAQLHRMTIYAKDPATGEKCEKPYSQMNGIWPCFIYETQPITSYARVWWTPGNWSNKWLLSPIARSEINKGYGLFQNPGWE